MTFTVTYKRHVSKFFFINNMSGWHFACHPHFNQAWTQETGPLTEEASALKAFPGIARRFEHGSHWLGRPFAAASTEEQALSDVEKMVGPADAETLGHVFSVMEPRFAKIWARDEERLIALADRLGERLRSEGMAQAIEVAERLYGSKLPDLEVLLILTRGRSIVGGANEGPDRITVGALEAEDIQTVVEVVLHEAIHLLEKDGFRDMYRDISLAHGLGDIEGDRYWNAEYLVREAIVEALVPGGALAPLMGGTMRDFASDSARQHAAGRHDEADRAALAGYYLPIVQEYIDAGKSFDADLVERAIAIFNERRGELAIGRTGMVDRRGPS